MPVKKIVTMLNSEVHAVIFFPPRRKVEVSFFCFKEISLIIHSVHESDNGRILLI